MLTTPVPAAPGVPIIPLVQEGFSAAFEIAAGLTGGPSRIFHSDCVTGK